jgi:hypothetical protein
MSAQTRRPTRPSAIAPAWRINRHALEDAAVVESTAGTRAGVLSAFRVRHAGPSGIRTATTDGFSLRTFTTRASHSREPAGYFDLNGSSTQSYHTGCSETHIVLTPCLSFGPEELAWFSSGGKSARCMRRRWSDRQVASPGSGPRRAVASGACLRKRYRQRYLFPGSGPLAGRMLGDGLE